MGLIDSGDINLLSYWADKILLLTVDGESVFIEYLLYYQIDSIFALSNVIKNNHVLREAVFISRPHLRMKLSGFGGRLKVQMARFKVLTTKFRRRVRRL